MSNCNDERLMSLKLVEQTTSLKKSTIYYLIKRGDFPSAHSITARRRAWAATEVQSWIEQRVGTGVAKTLGMLPIMPEVVSTSKRRAA